MYRRRPGAGQLEALGFAPDDFGSEEVGVWPENWDAFRLFEALSTQWRLGPCGPAGLDYCAIGHVARLLGLERRRTAELFPAIRAMEGAALGVLHDKED